MTKTLKLQLTPVEQDAGDDEHRRHRQHMRERSRGRPLGGFLHAFFSLDLGVTHRCAVKRKDGQLFYSEHPTCDFAAMCPHAANIDCLKVDQQCGGNLTR